MPLTWGDVMKFIVEADLPMEPFSTYIREGTAGDKIGAVLGALKPEVIYFTDSGVGRGVLMIVDLDSAGQIPHVTEPLMLTFGAVRMEPGPPGSAHATPRGTFTVMWKGGPNVVSNIYNEPMPWAVQFTSGGVAFHAGSLTLPSHGCVHLTMANAHYYNEHLAIGAEVVVF